MTAIPTISVDAMGGDLGPQAVVEGIGHALKRWPDRKVKYLLHGDEALLKPLLDKNPKVAAVCELRHTDTLVQMTDKPSEAVRRARGAEVPVYIGDQTRGSGLVRSLGEQVALEADVVVDDRVAPLIVVCLERGGEAAARQGEEALLARLGRDQVGIEGRRRVVADRVLGAEVHQPRDRRGPGGVDDEDGGASGGRDASSLWHPAK